ncbi:hypothetical protein O181_033341 [Austropuccinia psidii MF-1]|uniref:Integrase zinc-binding domain-containing protein n=1 Tax=Austropuccinia psidii MF-1 TaxID=1389203 RepID=A0A9Q3D495_9BASI|nr:hypothetical protein [Austropuccinia psidii MF-1]
MTSTDRTLIRTILHECHESFVSAHLSEDMTLEMVKACSWWPNWRKYVAEYFKTCDRCQKAKRAKGKKFVMMIQIQEAKSLLETAHMDWVTALSPGGERSFNARLVLVGRIISHTGLFQNIVNDRDPKFASPLWTNIHSFFGEKLLFSTAYHPQAYVLEERMIQTLEDMITRFCDYGLESKYSDGFTQYWCTLIPALELAYKTSITSLIEKPPAILEKGWNPSLPY